MNENKEIFFHEDDYCQIELLPLENILLINQTSTKIGILADKADEEGLAQIYSRDEIKHPLSFLNINLMDFEQILRENALSYFDKVYTGYSTERIFKEGSRAFGFENYLIFYEFNSANSIITKAWISYKQISQTLNIPPIRLKNTLIKLADSFDLILVDWNELMTVNLKKLHDLEDYIQNVL